MLAQPWRKSAQPLLPVHLPQPPRDGYDLYPAYALNSEQISIGFEALADIISGCHRVVIDGFGGVFWGSFREQLQNALVSRGIQAAWMTIDAALYTSGQIITSTAPFTGGDDPLFGTRYTGSLREFFDPAKLDALKPDSAAPISILYGCGAALADWDADLLLYLDLPKSEVQFRARAGYLDNIGNIRAPNTKAHYKRCYFVDWPALNEHRAALVGSIDWVVDVQHPESPAALRGTTWRTAMSALACSVFRVRPWFEPGPWGGQWLKAHIPVLPQEAPNYAWSFEFISPENGLLFTDGSALLETSFDWLMLWAGAAVLGKHTETFGPEFPIRFDFLDTFEGGNLSLQCHPRLEYARAHFGERCTQDETYYILDCDSDARVYLGFQQGIDPAAFRVALEMSQTDGTPLPVERFVSSKHAHQHDLFLIPNGTIHCAGRDTLVLEISATPYIFTFKMYDWLRADLDGKPRTLNIARAFENLRFEYQGDVAQETLIAAPRCIDEGSGWQLFHLPTHPHHFYDVQRAEFTTKITLETAGSPHILSLVEGDAVLIAFTNGTDDGTQHRFCYAETFVIPAAAERYTLISPDGSPLKVVIAYIKLDAAQRLGLAQP